MLPKQDICNYLIQSQCTAENTRLTVTSKVDLINSETFADRYELMTVLTIRRGYILFGSVSSGASGFSGGGWVLGPASSET